MIVKASAPMWRFHFVQQLTVGTRDAMTFSLRVCDGIQWNLQSCTHVHDTVGESLEACSEACYHNRVNSLTLPVLVM